MPVALGYVPAGLLHRLVGAAPRAEAIAVWGKPGVKDGCQYLKQGLLERSSSTVGMPNSRSPPPGFGISTRRTGMGR